MEGGGGRGGGGREKGKEGARTPRLSITQGTHTHSNSHALESFTYTQVQKHAERLAAAKQAATLEALAARFPGASPAVLAAALEEVPDADPAAAGALVRLFSEANKEHLADWGKRLRAVRGGGGASTSGGSEGGGSDRGDHRRRRQSKKEKGDRKKKKSSSRRRRSSRRGSSEEDGSGDSDDSDDARRRRHKQGSKHKRTRRRSSDDEEDKEKKKAKAAAAKPAAAFGARGILRAGDLEARRPEFTAWAAEVKGVDVDALPGRRGGGVERELFAEFAEDFNTGTLPDDKYYDLGAWAAKGGGKKAGGGGGNATAQTDEAAAAAARVAEREAAQAARVRDAYLALKFSDAGKVEAMKAQALMRTEAALAFKTGDSAKAARLMEKLKPEERR